LLAARPMAGTGTELPISSRALPTAHAPEGTLPNVVEDRRRRVFPVVSGIPGLRWSCFESGHLLHEAATHETAPIPRSRN
jgi:hypothetical protein